MGAVAEKPGTGTLSAEAYLAFLRFRPHGERWQLIDGVAAMMTPPTVVHQLIAMNFAWLLNNALQESRPDLVALVELGLAIPGHANFLPIADLAVVDRAADYTSYAGRFYLTAETLSDSNTQEYIAQKLERYAEHPDNLYNLVISQREMRVELWSRASGWKGVVLRSRDDAIGLPEFGFRCALADLYRGTPLA